MEHKECPRCESVMHRCARYVPAVYEGQKLVSPARGCPAQQKNPEGQRNHDEGDRYICLFCGHQEALVGVEG